MMGTAYHMNHAHDYAGQITRAARAASEARYGIDTAGHGWPYNLATPADYLASEPDNLDGSRPSCGHLRLVYGSRLRRHWANIRLGRTGRLRAAETLAPLEMWRAQNPGVSRQLQEDYPEYNPPVTRPQTSESRAVSSMNRSIIHARAVLNRMATA